MDTSDIADGVWHVCRARNQVNGTFIPRDTTKTGRDQFIPMDAEIVVKVIERGPSRVFSESPGRRTASIGAGHTTS